MTTDDIYKESKRIMVYPEELEWLNELYGIKTHRKQLDGIKCADAIRALRKLVESQADTIKKQQKLQEPDDNRTTVRELLKTSLKLLGD